MSKKSKNVKIVGCDGPSCPQCDYPTEIREHVRVTENELAKPFYYSRWYICRNRGCTTTTIMLEEFKVWKGSGEAERTPDVGSMPAEHRDNAPELRNHVSANDRPPWE